MSALFGAQLSGGFATSGIGIVLFALLPMVVWLVYIRRRDRLEKEPWPMMLLALALGILSALLTLVVGAFIRMPGILAAVVQAPIVEESLKFLLTLLFLMPHRQFNEPMDGLIYGTGVALGFAGIENIFYLQNAAADGVFWTTAFVRAGLSVPGHALFAMSWGFAMGMIKFGHWSPLRLFPALLTGIGLHALFNLMASLQLGLGIILFVLIIPMWRRFNRLSAQAGGLSPHAPSAIERF